MDELQGKSRSRSKNEPESLIRVSLLIRRKAKRKLLDPKSSSFWETTVLLRKEGKRERKLSELLGGLTYEEAENLVVRIKVEAQAETTSYLPLLSVKESQSAGRRL